MSADLESQITPMKSVMSRKEMIDAENYAMDSLIAESIKQIEEL